jgi:hypothetical protein
LNWGFDGATGYSEYEDQYGSLWNLAHTAAEVKDVKNIPFKWQYGSQTLITPSDDCAADNTGNWTDVNCALSHAASEYTITVATGATAASTSDAAALTVGKRYRATVLFKDGTGAGATASINVLTNAGASLAVGTPITVAAAYAQASVTWIATETNNKVQLLVAAASVADGETVLIDTITTNALGAVALYTQDSISETTWYDKANGNDGAVTGAEVLNPPSVSPLLAMHTNTIKIQPGGTAGTNINCTDQDVANWGQLALTDATNLGNDSTVNSFTLNDGSTQLTINFGKEVVGILGYGIRIHDINSSSASELYTILPSVVGGNIEVGFMKRPTVAFSDYRTIFDAGDRADIWISYVTAT